MEYEMDLNCRYLHALSFCSGSGGIFSGGGYFLFCCYLRLSDCCRCLVLSPLLFLLWYSEFLVYIYLYVSFHLNYKFMVIFMCINAAYKRNSCSETDPRSWPKLWWYLFLWCWEVLSLLNNDLAFFTSLWWIFMSDCVCYVIRDVSELSKTFPQVDMVFGNGQKLTLSPENYLFRVIYWS